MWNVIVEAAPVGYVLLGISVLSVGVIVERLLFWIGRRAAGNATALIAVMLFALNPLALGHGSLMTADMALTAFFLLTGQLVFEGSNSMRLLPKAGRRAISCRATPLPPSAPRQGSSKQNTAFHFSPTLPWSR